MTKEGKAYGFLKCDKSLAEIEEAMHLIRNCIGTPSKLELSLVEGIGNIKGDKLLHETVIKDLEEEGKVNYALEARLEKVDNRKTADELTAMLNQAYQSPLFEPKPKDFYATVVYEKNGRYEQLD